MSAQLKKPQGAGTPQGPYLVSPSTENKDMSNHSTAIKTAPAQDVGDIQDELSLSLYEIQGVLNAMSISDAFKHMSEEDISGCLCLLSRRVNAMKEMTDSGSWMKL